jgi:putative aldouronate transport system substrate-binding protein
MAAAGITDPTYPLYSPTNGGPGVPARQAVIDGINNIVTGRDPLTSFDQLVADWKTKAGDKIRAEYQDALQAAK